MVDTSPELHFPQGLVTAQDIALGADELIPGVNVPRPGTNFRLTPGTAAYLKSDIAIRSGSALQNPPEGESETLPG